MNDEIAVGYELIGKIIYRQRELKVEFLTQGHELKFPVYNSI